MEDIGGELDGELAEIAVDEDGSIPDGGTIINIDLADKDDVGGDICIDSDLRYPLPQGEDDDAS